MKKSSSRSDGFFEDFFEWMGSSEGAKSMEILDCVADALDGARANPFERKIIWPDGESMSIEQSVERIRRDSGFEGQAILAHVIGWLQMEYVPEGFDEEQMEQFENQIEGWVEEYENDHQHGV
jgi:hypothetical protein